MASTSSPRPYGDGRKSTCLLVLGMHRSGTSAVTRVLNIMGADLGLQLLKPGRSNELGFWEHQVAYEQDEWLLGNLGRSWDDVRSLPEGWQQSPAYSSARSRLVGALGKDFANSALWAIKDPRVCRLLPLWKDVVESLGSHAAAVIVVRNPAEVASSLAARDGLSFDHGCMLWARYMLDAERDSRGLRRCVVSYDELLGDWRGALNGIQHSLDIGFPNAADECAEQIEAYLDEGQRHHSAKSGEHQSPEWMGALYREFQNAASDPSAWQRIREAGREFQKISGALDSYTEKLVVSVGVLEKVAAKVDWQSTALGEFGDYLRQQSEASWRAQEQLAAKVDWQANAVVGLGDFLRDQVQAEREGQERLAAKVDWQASALVALGDFLRDQVQAEREGQDRLAAKVDWQASTLVGLGDFLRDQVQAEREGHERLAANVQWQSDALASFGEHLRQQVDSNRLAQEQLHGEIARLDALLAASVAQAASEAAPLRAQVHELEQELAQRAAELDAGRLERESSARRHAEALAHAGSHAAQMEQSVAQLRSDGSRLSGELAELRLNLEASTSARLHAERRAAGFLERIEVLTAQVDEGRRLAEAPHDGRNQREEGLLDRWKSRRGGTKKP